MGAWAATAAASLEAQQALAELVAIVPELVSGYMCALHPPLSILAVSFLPTGWSPVEQQGRQTFSCLRQICVGTDICSSCSLY